MKSEKIGESLLIPSILYENNIMASIRVFLIILNYFIKITMF